MRLFLFFLLLFASTVFSQDNKIIRDEVTNKPMLVGITSKEAYQDSSFSNWFNSEYTNYIVDVETLVKVKNNFEGKVIKIVLGTWCSDSRREVPRFVKILDFMNFPEDKLLFMNVDRDRKGLSGETKGLNIEFVPTIIVYESGKEIGRIIESPMETLEKDLVKIVSQN